MQNRKYNIAPRVLIQELRGKYTSPPLSKVELDILVRAIYQCGVENGFNRMSDDTVRYALDELSAAI